MIGDNIHRLVDKVRMIYDTNKNQDKLLLWESGKDQAGADTFRAQPKPWSNIALGGQSAKRVIPFTMEPENTMWAHILGFDIIDFYNNPLVYLKAQLEMAIYRHKHFRDDTPVGKSIAIWLSVAYEPSLFGMDPIYVKDNFPWAGRDPVITNERDLASLALPVFGKQGLDSLAIKYYETIQDILADVSDFSVIFPEWGKGPFPMALHLRGMANLLVDLKTNPCFVHELMDFVTTAREKWYVERTKYLGRTHVGRANLYDDEVNCPMISVDQYEEFVLPYEIRLSKFHGGILYWHSCGNITLLMASIHKIPGLQMIHVGPWTDPNVAVSIFRGQAVEVCVHPVEDVQMADRIQMRQKLEQIIESCDNHRAFTVRADALQVMTTIEKDLGKALEWVEIAQSVLH